MNPLLEVFTENLKRVRKSRDLTQEELSRLCNYDRTYLGKIERGQKYPSLDVVSRVARVLDVSVAELFAGPEEFNEFQYLRPRQERDQRKESVYRDVFETDWFFIVLLEDDGVVTRVSSGLLEFTGDPADAFEGEVFWETPLWPEGLREQCRDDINRCSQGYVVHSEYSLPGPDGSVRLTTTYTPEIEAREGIEHSVLEGMVERRDEVPTDAEPEREEVET